MPSENWPSYRKFRTKLRNAFVGPQLLAFLPAVTLGGYWFGGEGFLLAMALVFPGAFAIAGMFSGTGPAWSSARDNITDLRLRSAAEKALSDILEDESSTGKTTAALVIEIDDFKALEQQYGNRACSAMLRQTGERLVASLREVDLVARLDGSVFAIALGPVRRADLETLIQMSSRLQAAIAEPYSVDATRIFATASIGFCLANKIETRSGSDLLEHAERALVSARALGGGAIRAYSHKNTGSRRKRSLNSESVADALENGQIQPWFQPQVSTHTGEITGFEALARWESPENGIISPADFLPALTEMSLLERLSEVMLWRSFSALRHWNKSGLRIPVVSVNFSSEELGNPKLCERIRWELDRFELTPANLCVEILEDVIAASDDDVIVRNIQALAKMGCPVDLDDFGTGHASIANIRRFSVNRIKIDRSFVTRVDRDREQQNVVAAILTMAERLGIDTLAEGVETIGEHAILGQLGCGHVQGFSIARPMPFENTEKWVLKHRAKMPKAPEMGRQAS